MTTKESTLERVPEALPGQPVPAYSSPQSLRQATVDIIIPVYNEEHSLPRCVDQLAAFISTEMPVPTSVIIADNASTDDTWEVAGTLCAQYDNVHRIHLYEKGRGRALKRAWLASNATVVAYMDVDLSTDLNGLLPLVAPLLTGHSDIAIGTRLARSSRVERGPKREFISRTYNLMLKTAMAAHFSDAQCGFKAMRTDVAARLLPHVEDNAWFFDTELLLLAEKAGYRVHEVPVDWIDDPDSRVNIIDTAVKDIQGMWRVGTGLITGKIQPKEFSAFATEKYVTKTDTTGQILRFITVGVASTIAYALLYLVFQMFMGPQAANFPGLAHHRCGQHCSKPSLHLRRERTPPHHVRSQHWPGSFLPWLGAHSR
jgi:probable glycosyltransferase